MADSTEIPDLIEDYRAALLRMDEQRLETGARPASWNRLVDEMQALHLRLRATEQGRAGITALVSDTNPTVRLWSATNALAWAPETARTELERTVRAGGLDSISAQATLRAYDAGRLATSWQPNVG